MKAWIIGGLSLALSGCAGTKVLPVANAGGPVIAGVKSDSEINGIRYYEGAHFLIVYSDGKGGLKSEVKFLPDLTRKRAVNPYAYFAINKTTLTFENGMLVGNKSTIDEAVIPKAALETLQKVVVAGLSSANKVGGSEKVYFPNPKIYKIVVRKDGQLDLLDGETRLTPSNAKIELTLQEPEK